MSYALNEEQCLIQQVAQEFAQEYVAPLAVEMDKKDEHPQALIKQMGEHDFLGLFYPAEYGGADADFTSFILAVEQLSKASGAVGSILIAHSARALYAMNRWGSVTQKRTYMNELCKGTSLGAFAWTEPDGAPGTGAEKLMAVKEGDAYVLNGRKAYVANGGAADVYIVSALTNPENGVKGMSTFIVSKDFAGLSAGRKIEKMGLRGCQSAELVFENVQVPAENLLGRENEGYLIAMETLAFASIAQGAQVVGIAQAALEDAVQYSKQRVQFRRPIANFPAVQTMLADIATNVHLVRLAVYHAANLVDQGESFKTEGGMIRYFANQIGQKACMDAIQVEGGYGYSQDMLVSRLFRDIKGTIMMDNSAEFPVAAIAANLLD